MIRLRAEILCLVSFFGPLLMVIWLSPLTLNPAALIVMALAYLIMRVSQNRWSRHKSREADNEQRFRRDAY
jgi:hypothetical protein